MLLSIVLSHILHYIDSIKDLDLDPDKEEGSLLQKSGPYDDSWLLRPLVNIQRCMQQLFPIRGELQERHLLRIAQTRFEPCSNRLGLLRN